jgi:hypothetical protein
MVRIWGFGGNWVTVYMKPVDISDYNGGSLLGDTERVLD